MEAAALDNPLATGAGLAAERAEAARQEAAREANDAARAAALADVDRYTCWLYDHCDGAANQHLLPTFLKPGMDMTVLPLQTLVAIQLYPNAAIAGAACMELQDRYLAHLGIES